MHELAVKAQEGRLTLEEEAISCGRLENGCGTRSEGSWDDLGRGDCRQTDALHIRPSYLAHPFPIESARVKHPECAAPSRVRAGSVPARELGKVP
jgi:hypothetical protein